LVDQFVDELGTRLPHRSLRLRALLLAICTSALRRGETSSTQSGPGTLSRAQRQTLESYVRQNPAARPTPAELASLVHLSHDYFSRLFGQTFGQSPRAWLVQQRVRRAARMLADSLQSVSQIAAALGYQDASAFSHQFTRWQGVSPRTYRQQQR